MVETDGSADISMIEAISKLPTVSVTFRVGEAGLLKAINFSDGFCRMMKCTEREARDFYAHDPSFRKSFFEDNKALIEYYMAHSGDTEPASFTYRVPLVHGGNMWVSVQFYSFCADGGRYVYVAFSDIDELKLHELELQEQYRSTQELIDSVSGTYMAVRRCNLTKNTVESINGIETLMAMCEAKDYDISIKTLLDFIPEAQDKKECAEYYSRSALTAEFEAGNTVVSKDYQLASEDGRVKWVHSTIHLTKRPGDGDIIAFSTVQDVNSAIMGEKLSAMIIDRNYDSVSYCDLRSKMLYVRSGRDSGKATFTETDYQAFMENAAAHVDAKQADGFRSGTGLENIIAALKNVKIYTFYYAENIKRDDLPGAPKRQMKMDIFYLDERRQILVFLLSDVTEILERDRETRGQMETALAAAKQASAAKSNFLSRMSHEIRTPLNAIIGMDTIAAQSVGSDERVADCIAKIGLSARYLLALINDILDMSRIESGKMLLKNESFMFPEFIAAVNNIIYPQVRAKGLDYECTVSSEICEAYIGDETKLQQILVNMLGNAVKFTARGRISLDISVVTREADREKLRFVISDTGCGISDENLARIFEPFEQEDTSTTTAFGGTGLGLAITKNLTNLMGGSLSVRSIVGVGSEFTADIPFAVDEGLTHRQKLMPNLKDLRTLIVDDDLFICEQTGKILRDIGMAGEWVTTGQEAVNKVKEKSEKNDDYDFILIDWKMPDMDGLETTQRIRKIVGPDVTIIIISAYDWQSIEAEARAAGANLMISKPLLRSTLVSAFEKALGNERNEEVETPVYDFSGKRVLVAEDNELNAEIARTLLEEKHFLVELAPNGIKALEKFAGNPEGYFDAILMDVRMPMMDGLQSAVNIRHWNRPDARTIPIIAMTANAFDEDVEKSRAAGMNAHISKPIDQELMFSTLYRLMEKGK